MFKIGDRVAYKASFLRSIGDYSYDSASMRGTVAEVFPEVRRGQQVLSIKWDGDQEVRGSLSGNLILKDRLHLEPA